MHRFPNLAVMVACLLAAPVTLAATYSTPVRIVDQPVATQRSKMPINADVQFLMSGSVINPGAQLAYTVPAGQRYVIESVSVWSFTTTCAFFLTPSITTTAGGEASEFRLPIPDRAYSPAGFYTHNSTWPVKLYADPGSSIFVNSIRTEGGCSVSIRVSLSGYLEYDE